MNQISVLLFAGLGIIVATPQGTWAQELETAQTSSAIHTQATVPRLVQFAGTLKDASAKPVGGLESVTFAIYQEQDGGTALWSETQNVNADAIGHYTALLGATTSGGVPVEIFGTERSRWLGVSIAGQPELPRVLLASVPYALKAVDAESLGGMPASAFVRANSSVAETATGDTQPNRPTASSSSSAPASGSTPVSSSAPAPAAPTVTGSGTKSFIPLWTSSTTLGNSSLFQNSAGNVGIGTLTPTQKFEVHSGNALVRGPLNFGGPGATAFLYVGDTNHPIEAIWNTGLAIGAYLVPHALFIQDRTGKVGIGTTTPASLFDVSGNSSNQIVTVTQTGSGNGIAASTTAPTAAAVEGLATDSTCFTEPCSAGVLGETTSPVHAAGVMGIAGGRSGTGLAINNGAGIWGDTNVGVSGAISVLGTTDDNIAISAINNGPDAVSLEAINFTTTPGADVFYAAPASGSSYCFIDTSGDLTCTGSKSAAVTLDSGRKVKLYAVEAPENWFEDFGASELHDGSAVISLDPAFTQTINAGAGYHVFLTPKADCRGLYVSKQKLTSFEVHELGGGTSSIAFDYRIAARRKGYENIRMADVTEHISRLQRSIPRLKPGRPAQSKTLASVKQ
jgi:hypothetical protein